LFTNDARFTRDGVNNTKNSHWWCHNNSHVKAESKYQRWNSVDVWCGNSGTSSLNH
jgi:hypothetical protein